MMNSIRSLFVFAALLLAGTLQAQVSANPEIQKRLDAYIDLTNQKKYSEAFDLMYPKVFSLVGKQELIDMMDAAYSDGLSLQLTSHKITTYSAPFTDGNETFVRIEFDADMAVQIAPGGSYDAQKPILGMLEGFRTTYGPENVKWDATKKLYTIHTHKKMLAIQEEGKEWYLIEINKDQMDLMKSLFSEAVINALVIDK